MLLFDTAIPLVVSFVVGFLLQFAFRVFLVWVADRYNRTRG